LMPYDEKSKKREELKKRVKALTNHSEAETADARTFITGTNLEEKQKEEHDQAEENDTVAVPTGVPKGHFKYQEDALLAEVDQHEKDMN